jgi:pyruvate/2-oxoglutarate dehydrogenase complex dihydrolipoamide dehydrogenase (E3) component
MNTDKKRPFDPNPAAVVIGSGSGGLTVAVGLTHFGKRVRMIERDRVGGECTNVGCIPSKALLHATANPDGRSGPEILAHVRERRDELWRHETDEFTAADNIDLQFGTARIVGPGRVEVTAADGSVDVVETDHIVVATGSRARHLPIEGLDHERVLTNENLFELACPPSHLAIVGGGPIGVEMATAFARLGTRVTVVDVADRVLPAMLAEASAIVTRSLAATGVDVRTGRAAVAYDATSGQLTLRAEADGATEIVDAVDRVLLAVGRVPNTDDLGLEDVGVEIDRGGHIVVDDKGRSSVKGIWAVGDASDRGGTTHAANAWGRRVIKAIVAPPAPAGALPVIPAVTFADPEAASIGEQPDEVPGDVRRVVVDLSRSDRAFTDEAGDGVVIVDVRRFSGRVLGATVVGPRAGELISVFSLAMKAGIRFPKWYGVVWPYPAYADVLGRAVDDFMGEHLRNLHRDFPRWAIGAVTRIGPRS